MLLRSISLTAAAFGSALGCALGVAPLVAQTTAQTTAEASAQQGTASGYQVTRRVPVPGDSGWDYVTFDTARSRIFISRSTRVQVVDANSGQLISEIQNTPGVHGVALAYDLNKGFTSNGRDTSVTVFDFVSLAPIKTIHVTGAGPDAILYDSATRRVFTFNGQGHSTTAIDAVADTVVGTLPLGGKPETAVSDGAGHIFVNIEDRGVIVEFDATTLAILHSYPLAPCEEPSGLAIDRQNHVLFVGCGNSMMAIVDATTGHIIATPPTGDGTDASAFDPVTGIAFSSNGAGTLSLVTQPEPGKFITENIPTAQGARTMALDPKTHRVYLVTADFAAAPAPTAAQPRPRRAMVPNSFVVLVVSK